MNLSRMGPERGLVSQGTLLPTLHLSASDLLGLQGTKAPKNQPKPALSRVESRVCLASEASCGTGAWKAGRSRFGRRGGGLAKSRVLESREFGVRAPAPTARSLTSLSTSRRAAEAGPYLKSNLRKRETTCAPCRFGDVQYPKSAGRGALALFCRCS